MQANNAYTRTGEIGLIWNYLVNSEVVGSPSPAGEAGVRRGSRLLQPVRVVSLV